MGTLSLWMISDFVVLTYVLVKANLNDQSNPNRLLLKFGLFFLLEEMYIFICSNYAINWRISSFLFGKSELSWYVSA